MPSLEDLKERGDAFLVLEDLMFANSEFLSKIYSVYSHHFHFSVLMTVQNLFHKGLCEISLNAQIMVLFKNCRDVNQISHFLRQIYPKMYKKHWRHIKTLYLRKEVIWSLIYAVKHTITNVFVQGFFQKTHIIFINELLAKKKTHLAFATKSPCTFAKAYSRQSIVRVNTLSL